MHSAARPLSLLLAVASPTAAQPGACLPLGSRCLRFRRHGHGFAAHAAGEPAFTLSR